MGLGDRARLCPPALKNAKSNFKKWLFIFFMSEWLYVITDIAYSYELIVLL